MAPAGKVRNLLGKQAAIAYREHGGEPFHYTVMSYDERGRLEAMIRFTENLGYDAVYYRYNSMNQLVEVKVEDPLNMHQSLYGYDWNGRVDSVWAVFSSGSGLHMGGGFKNPYYHATGNSRKDTADIVYQYTKLGAVDTMQYPLVGVVVNYDYNSRKWLDSIVATKGGNPLFMEVLGYDSSGQIVWQRYKHGTQAEVRQDYLYDRINRLIGWIVTGMPDTMRYTYDAVGNRLTDSLTWKQGAYRYGQATGVGPNRLMRMVDSNVQTGFVLDSTRYTYDWDGATTRRIRVDLNAGTTVDEKFKYSYRDLLRRYTASPGGTVIAQDWRYRYNPFGEREQKRMYYMGIDTLGAGYQHPWVYYLLGGSKEQLAVWHGLETCDPMCSDTGQRVYMYPVEYLTFGSGTAKVITQPDGVQQYKLLDHLGTSRAVVVSTGSTISETDYEPFGEPIPVSGSVPRLSYIDKEGDFENKLGDYGVRKYDAKIGRFLSNDDLWESNPSMSAYIYVGDDPVNGVDPTGFEERPGFNVKNNAPSEIVLIGGQGRESLNQGDIFEPILNEDGSRTGRIYRKNGRIDNVQLHDVDGVQIQSGQIFRINGAYDVSLNNVEEQGDSDFGPYHIKIHNSVIQRVFGGATGVGTLEIDPSDERTLKLSQTGIFPWSITILPPTVRKGQSARPIGSPPRGQKIPDGL